MGALALNAHSIPQSRKECKPMKIGDLLMTLVIAIVVTVFVFFRCRSILEEKDEPAQDHVTAQQGQDDMLDAPENPAHGGGASAPQPR